MNEIQKAAAGLDPATVFEPAPPADPSGALQDLYEKLLSAYPDIDAIDALFCAHVETGFLPTVLLVMLQSVAANPDQPIPGIAGQVSFSLINCPEFNYSVRLIPPFKATAHAVRCLGARQVLGVKGNGRARFRILRPAGGGTMIAPGTRFEVAREVDVEPGSTIRSESDLEVLDLWEANGPVVIEALSIQSRRNRLYWHLSKELQVSYAECGSISASRLQNVLDLARAMRCRVPDAVYDRVLQGSDVQEKMCAIRSLLGSDRERGFKQLQEAIDSDDLEYSAAAQALFSALLKAA